MCPLAIIPLSGDEFLLLQSNNVVPDFVLIHCVRNGKVDLRSKRYFLTGPTAGAADVLKELGQSIAIFCPSV